MASQGNVAMPFVGATRSEASAGREHGLGYGERKLILFEEVDTTDDADKGFLPTLAGIIASSKHPVVLTANALDAGSLPADLPVSVVRRASLCALFAAPSS